MFQPIGKKEDIHPSCSYYLECVDITNSGGWHLQTEFILRIRNVQNTSIVYQKGTKESPTALSCDLPFFKKITKNLSLRLKKNVEVMSALLITKRCWIQKMGGLQMTLSSWKLNSKPQKSSKKFSITKVNLFP